MKLCKRCNKEVKAKRSDAQFCSAICRASHRQEQKKEEVKLYKQSYYALNKDVIDGQNMANYYANKPILEKRNCKQCDIEFQPTRTDNEFCTPGCGIAFWRSNNKEYIKADQEDRYHNDIDRKISTCLRSRLNKALKGNVKSQATMALIGCSIDQLKQHHGRYNPRIKTWHIDHIVPMSKFDLSNPNDQQRACSYENLQPMLAKNNLMKGSK
jgi:predicted RNA-binding Zn-ribbon protein involved in translation (DUF1610 family)